MSLRQDALAAAAQWIVEVERYAANYTQLVATVGRISTEPGAVNVIPAPSARRSTSATPKTNPATRR